MTSTSLRCNPRFGLRPDLFGSDTDFVVSTDDMSREELMTLKKSNFSNAELKIIEANDIELFEMILENSQEDIKAVLKHITNEILKEIRSRTTTEKLIEILRKNIDDAAESAAYNIAIKSKNVSARNIEAIEARLKNHKIWTVKLEPLKLSERADWSYPLNEEPFEVIIDIRPFMLSDKELDKLHYDMDKVISDATGAEDITMKPCHSDGKKLSRGYDGFFAAEVFAPAALAAYADMKEKEGIGGNIAKFLSAIIGLNVMKVLSLLICKM